jgi:hypothetical protein
MQFILGLLSGAVFLSLLILAFYLGQRRHLAPKREANEDEQRRAEKLRKDFQTLMQYDLKTAMQRKKVT